MTKFGTDPRLWPASAGPRKRGLSSLNTVHTWVGLVVVLIAGLSLADQMAWPSADSAVHAPPLAPDAVATPGVCWHDWPYIRTNCDDNPAGAATSAAATPHTRQVRDAAVSSSAPAIGAPIVAATSFAPRAGTGTPPVATTDGAGPPAPSASPVPSAPPTQIAATPAAAPSQLPERELTFKHGYALRRAVQAPAEAAASPAPSAPAKLAQAKPKRRKVRTASQVYELPDGRRVVVHRRYGEAQADARTGWGGYAEAGPQRFTQRFGEPFGGRSGWFNSGGNSALY